MGTALWLASALLAVGIARIVPQGRPAQFVGELLVAIVTAVVIGVTATGFDLGGWRELDWRPALLILFGVLATLGFLRAGRLILTTR